MWRVLIWRISCCKTCSYIFPCHIYCITIFSGGFGLVRHFKDKSGIFCVNNSSLRCLHFGQFIKKKVIFMSHQQFLFSSLLFMVAVSIASLWSLIHAVWLMILIYIPPLLHKLCVESYLSQEALLLPGWTLASLRWTPSAQTASSTLQYPAVRHHPAPSPPSGECGAEGSRSRPLPASAPLEPPLPAACAPQRARGNSGTRWPERDRADSLAPLQQ